LTVISIPAKKHWCKEARALKEPEGSRVDVPQQLN